MKSLFLLVALAFLFRLVLVPLAYHGDLNNNLSWGEEGLERGLVNFFEGQNWPNSAPNQPPLYILTFTLLSFIWSKLHLLFWSLNSSLSFFPSNLIHFWENWGMIYLLKLPGILADLGIALFIFNYFKKNKRKALLLSGLWLVNPVVWYNSSIWGQTDSVVNLFGLLSVYYLLKKNLSLASLLFTVSFLYKGSLALFTPILILVALKQGYKLNSYVKALLLSLATIIISALWFHPQMDVLVWLFNLYKDRFFPGEIGDLTANAFNAWWLVNPGKVLDSTLIAGVSARSLGVIITTILFVPILLALWQKVTKEKVWYTVLLVSFIAFLFMTRIHERYLYPFFPAATLMLGFQPSLLILYIAVSFLHLINLYHLFWAPSIMPLEVWYKENWLMLGNVVAMLTIIIFAVIYLKYCYKHIVAIIRHE